MTVSSEVNRAGPYLGNGSTTVFGFGFRILSASHLRVIITDEDGDETDLPYPSGYSVTGVGANAGGSITISPAPVTGSRITILRNVPMVQETDLENQGAYYAETVERQLDLIVMQNQQQSEELRRAVKVPAGDPDPDGALSSDLAMGILRLYASAGNIDTVAGQADAIDTVAATIVQVQTVANGIAAVQTVAGSIGDVGTVADDIVNVRAVAGVSDEVSIVATNIDTLLGASGSFLSMVPAILNGDGTTTEFSIPAPSTTANVIVWVNKVRQTPGDDYEVDTSTLTFFTAPAAGAEIELLIVTAVSLEAVQDLYDEFVEGVTIQKRNIITTAGQRRYAVDAAGAALSLRAATSAVFGASPFGMLTLGVDYTIDDGALLLSFDPADGELFHVIAFPRVSNSAAQVILQEFEDRVAADADRAEAATRPFAGYAAALEYAPSAPPTLTRVSAIISGLLIEWVRQSDGPCLGGGWVPADTATPQHFGTASGGWQIAINAALSWLSAKGGGRLLLPHIVGGYIISGDVIIRDRVELEFEAGAFLKVADGSHNVRAIATHRFNEFADDPRNRNDAPRGWKITNGWIEGNAANVTTSGGPWDGVGCALYGADFDIEGLRIYNAKGHALLTFFDGWSGGVHGWNGRARNIYIDGAGRHGWWNRVSDIHVEDVNITQVSQDANLQWDGMLLERSVRMVNFNSWNSTLRTASFMRAGINVQTGGVTIENAHIETAATCLLINGDNNMIKAYLYSGMGTFYCSVGGNFNKLDLTITNASNWFDTFRAIQIGRSDKSAAYNFIKAQTAGTYEAIVEFTNSASYNVIEGNCFTTNAGELFRGSPGSLDKVFLQGVYNGVYKDYKKDPVFSGTTTATGTDQATATLIERTDARVVGGNGTVGVRLRPAFAGMTQRITNSGSGVLKVYPASGNQFSLLGLNVAYDLPAFTTVTFNSTTSSVWVVV